MPIPPTHPPFSTHPHTHTQKPQLPQKNKERMKKATHNNNPSSSSSLHAAAASKTNNHVRRHSGGAHQPKALPPSPSRSYCMSDVVAHARGQIRESNNR